MPKTIKTGPKNTLAVDRAMEQATKSMAPISVFAKAEAQDYITYKCSIVFDNWIMGGIPQRVDIIEGWLRKGIGIESGEELKQKALETLKGLFPDIVTSTMTYEQAVKVTEGMAESHVNTFKRGPTGVLYIEGRQIKAMLKEAINIRYPKERIGHGKGAKKFTEERAFVEPEMVPLGVKAPSGRHLFVGHVSDQRGERSTLTYYDYVAQPRLSFLVKVQSTAVAELEDRWPLIWVTAEKNGLGALRSQGYGTFVVTEWSKIK